MSVLNCHQHLWKLIDYQPRVIVSLSAGGNSKKIAELKRRMVTTLVRRVTIDCDRELHAEIRLNLLKILTDDTVKGFEGKNKGEIKTIGLYPGWRDAS